jgi:hypothetical protein
VVAAYLRHHLLHATQHAQQLHQLFRQEIQASGRAHPHLPRVVPSGSEVPALAAYFPAVAAGPFLGRRELLRSEQQLLKRPGVAVGSLKVRNEALGRTSASLALHAVLDEFSPRGLDIDDDALHAPL